VNACGGKHIFITLLEDGTLDVQEEDECNYSFSVGTDHKSVLEWAEEDKIFPKKLKTGQQLEESPRYLTQGFVSVPKTACLQLLHIIRPNLNGDLKQYPFTYIEK
jgi:hypothetical protein